MLRIRRTLTAMAAAICLLSVAPAWAGNGQNLIQYVPADMAVVFHLNVEQVRASQIYQTIWGLVSAEPEVQEGLAELEAAAGFDPTTDISGVLITLNPENEERYGILVEGSFDLARIQTFLNTHMAENPGEMTSMEYAGHTVYHDPSETSADKAYFSLINDGLVAIGTQDELSAILDTMAGTRENVTTNAAVNAQLGSVDMSGAYWFAAQITPSMQAELVGSPMAGMSGVRGNGTITGGIAANTVLTTNSEQEAASMATFMNAGLAEAAANPEAAGMLAAMGISSLNDLVNVSNAGTEVTVNVNVPEQTVNQIVGFITAMMAAEGGGFGPQ